MVSKTVCKYTVRDVGHLIDDVIGIEIKNLSKQFYGKFYREVSDKAREFCNSPHTYIAFTSEIKIE